MNNNNVNVPDLYESDEPLPRCENDNANVTWPNSGGLVISEFDTNMWNVEVEKEVAPEDLPRL